MIYVDPFQFSSTLKCPEMMPVIINNSWYFPEHSTSTCYQSNYTYWIRSCSGYDYMRDSGSLSFWDDPDEDMYTFEDGEPL
jgi:hypothetical protein